MNNAIFNALRYPNYSRKDDEEEGDLGCTPSDVEQQSNPDQASNGVHFEDS